jgi:hypothetical protein
MCVLILYLGKCDIYSGVEVSLSGIVVMYNLL